MNFEGVDLEALARREGTPLYVYSSAAIHGRLQGLQSALHGMDALVCYAVKANSNQAILQLMADVGAGADIVSGGELRRCLRAGIPADRIVFSGVGKRADEIEQALDAGVARFNVESRAELELIQQIAAARGEVARASVRINPDVDALTHAKISTGKSENKFGVSITEARSWFATSGERPAVRLDGLHMHIGSQILNMAPIREALQRMAAFWRELEAAGHAIASIDVGGGLGVRYREGEQALPAADYVAEVRSALHGFKGRILLEPGRYLVAEAGVLLTRVLLTKHGEQRDFLVLDAAMNDLLRPSLYDAWHDIERIGDNAGRPTVAYDVVGPVCETGDTFALGRLLPRCDAGDLVAIRGAGAYGASMASTYNSRPLPAEVLVDGGRYAVVRRRQSFDEMIAGERPATDWERP
ncbi:diaminopimelate decarboxylase [Luteimonas sp. 8-5]|uniref:diaminopimelate decarboxylase n=1 Tax=Luteimonas sp. 8-5 TaxID=3039387 RepID=UPI002436CB1B|nr:diaminopimelate decarboxylase [Luteimonas sp. 8-5]MDG6348450.1 diaminopimelate decarboxylase [Luteimonas sp. 8-5]